MLFLWDFALFSKRRRIPGGKWLSLRGKLLASDQMIAALKFRLAMFGLAIVLSAMLIGWAAHLSWRNAGSLGEKLTRVQIESFQTADQFRANLQALNSHLTRYARLREPADRERFAQDWKKMDAWIDVQRPSLTTPQEGTILDQINVGYDEYHNAADNLINVIESGSGDAGAPTDELEKQTQHLLDLSNQLIAAHRDSLSLFLEDSRRELQWLRVLIVCGLAGLLALSAWLAIMVYREMIAPLQVKLVESAAVIERQEKLASLGLLAAGVAHEIRNPLTAIKARLFTHQRKLPPGSAERGDVEFIGGEINRLERIVRDILQFARPDEPQLAPVCADKLMEEVSVLMSPALAQRHVAVRIGPSETITIAVDAAQIKQVLINLVQNAADVTPERGVIELRTRRETVGRDGTTTVGVIEVVDHGKGIPPEVEKRLFDPFFTTKENGTGLGLAIAARIVGKHGGQLRYQTQAGRGTTFAVALPEAKET